MLMRAVRAGDFTPPRAIDPSIERALEAICRKAMSLRPEDRYATARALSEDLDRWMADEPVAAYRDPPAARLGRWARRHKPAVAGAVGLADHDGDRIGRQHLADRPRAAAHPRRLPRRGGTTEAGRRTFPPGSSGRLTTCTPKWPNSGWPISRGWSRSSANSWRKPGPFMRSWPQKTQAIRPCAAKWYRSSPGRRHPGPPRTSRPGRERLSPCPGLRGRVAGPLARGAEVPPRRRPRPWPSGRDPDQDRPTPGGSARLARNIEVLSKLAREDPAPA